MRTITQNIKVELESAERVTLNQARTILGNLLETMKDNCCSSAYFEYFGDEHTASDIQNAFELIEALAEENPIIE